jgi:hypothetical protein
MPALKGVELAINLQRAIVRQAADVVEKVLCRLDINV